MLTCHFYSTYSIIWWNSGLTVHAALIANFGCVCWDSNRPPEISSWQAWCRIERQMLSSASMYTKTGPWDGRSVWTAEGTNCYTAPRRLFLFMRPLPYLNEWVVGVFALLGTVTILHDEGVKPRVTQHAQHLPQLQGWPTLHSARWGRWTCRVEEFAVFIIRAITLKRR